MIRPTGIRVSGAALRRMLGLPDGPPEHVTGVTLDSRRVRPGDLYAALPGFTTHGARFAGMAQAAGAAAILTDPSGAELIGAAHDVELPVLVVDDPRGVLGAVSAWVYGDPAGALATTGITGTNGKTTVSYLLDAALRAGGHTTGVIGTVATHIGDEVLPATRTTPEASDLHALLAVMRERGASAVTMEVSSHALELGRVDGVHFDLAVFTNLTQDHLDFHGTMEAYYVAKAKLFTADRAAAGLVCVDDEWGRRLADGGAHPGHDVRTGRPGGLDGHRCGPRRPGHHDLHCSRTRCRGARRVWACRGCSTLPTPSPHWLRPCTTASTHTLPRRRSATARASRGGWNASGPGRTSSSSWTTPTPRMLSVEPSPRPARL